MAETGAEALEVARVGVWLFGPARDRLHRVHLYHRSTGEHVAGGELRRDHFPEYFEALAAGTELVVPDVHEDPRTRGLSETYAAPLGIGSWIDAPVGEAEAPRGIVRFEHLGPPREWTDGERAVAGGMAAAVNGLLAYWETRGRARREAVSPEREVAPAETSLEESPGNDAPEPPPPERPSGPTATPGRPAAEWLLAETPARVGLLDLEGRLVTANRGLARLLGYRAPAELEGTSLRDRLRRPGEWDELVTRVRDRGELTGWELQVHHPDDHELWLLLDAVWSDDVPDAGPDAGILISAVDITDLRQARERLERQANRDALTGAANRRLLYEAAENALALADRHGRQVGFLYVDLRRFKEINDRYGHEVGDRVLTHVADRLRAKGRESDVTARIGGDEFVVLLSEVEGGIEGARRAAERLRDSLSRPIKVDDLAIDADVSIGVALYPDHGSDARTLIRRADEAMYRGKRSADQKVVVCEQPGGGEESRDDDTIDAGAAPEEDTGRLSRPDAARTAPSRPAGLKDEGEDLIQELGEAQLDLDWQPIQRVSDGERVGAEGYLRWKHPELGRLPAHQFIDRLEESHRIVEVDRWVVEQASGPVAEWVQSGRVKWVALNVSPVSLSSPEFVEFLVQRVHSGELPAESVLLETALGLDNGTLADAAAALATLREWGFGTALDLSETPDELARDILETVEVDILEATPEFLERMADGPIARTIRDVRRKRGLALLAKMLESEGDYRRAVESGCELVQGHYVAPGTPARSLD